MLYLDTDVLLSAASGSLACVCTIFTGSRLYSYAPSPRGFIGGREVRVVFIVYGLLQLGAPWLGASNFRYVLYPLALALKIPCSLSVVAIALRGAFQKSSYVQGQLKAANAELETRELELRNALESSQDAQRSSHLRQLAQHSFGSIITESTRLPEALHSILLKTIDFLGSSKGLLYLYQPVEPGAESTLNLSAFVGVDPKESHLRIALPPTLETLEEGDLRCQRLSVLTPLAEGLFSSKCISVMLNKSLQDEVGWIIADLPSEPTDLDLRLSIVEDSLGRIVIGMELVHSREVLSLLEALAKTDPQELDKQQEFDRLLLKVPELLVRSVNATEVLMDVTTERTEDHYQCHWPDMHVNSSKRLRQSDDVLARSSYPKDIRIERLARVNELPMSMVRLPLKGIQDQTVGVLRCKGKRNEAKNPINLAFDHYDVRKLKAVGEVVSTAIVRARTHRSIEVLVARHVHELRNPVGSLRNIVHWLQKEIVKMEIDPDSRINTKIRDAELDVESLRQLIDLIDIFRGQTSERLTPTQIFGDIILKAVPQLRHRLHRLGLERSQIHIEVEDVRLMPTLVLVRPHAQQIILNLIDNALKYRKIGPSERFHIRFRADFDAHFYKLRVADWGIGIPPGWEERIFADGERAPNAVKLSVGGMGVGLHIAKELAVRMGGGLTLVSSENPTEFELCLPKGLRDDTVHRRRANN